MRSLAPQGCSILPHPGVVEHHVERERIAPQGLGDVALAVAAQQVQGKDTRIVANVACVLS